MWYMMQREIESFLPVATLLPRSSVRRVGGNVSTDNVQRWRISGSASAVSRIVYGMLALKCMFVFFCVCAVLVLSWVTALGLPLVSIVMLLMRLHENALVSCLLYLVAVFQALWLIGEFRVVPCMCARA